jgi:hypothetical protein
VTGGISTIYLPVDAVWTNGVISWLGRDQMNSVRLITDASGDTALEDTSPHHDPAAKVLSVTEGSVVTVGVGTVTTDFGPSAVVVRTPKGNFATYGRLASAAVALRAVVNRGSLIGTMEYLGRVSRPGILGAHLQCSLDMRRSALTVGFLE